MLNICKNMHFWNEHALLTSDISYVETKYLNNRILQDWSTTVGSGIQDGSACYSLVIVNWRNIWRMFVELLNGCLNSLEWIKGPTMCCWCSFASVNQVLESRLKESEKIRQQGLLHMALTIAILCPSTAQEINSKNVGTRQKFKSSAEDFPSHFVVPCIWFIIQATE